MPRMLLILIASLSLLALEGCSSDRRLSRGDGGGADGGIAEGGTGDGGPVIPFASIAGTVWAPGNAPGMVPANEEIPVFGAAIRLMVGRPAAIPQGVYCEECVDIGGFGTTSAHDGTFSLSGVTPGDYWLVIEKGQFRLERQLHLDSGEDAALDATMTTLPSVHNPSIGDWVPRIAVAAGSYDHIEDVVGKMGIGGVDAAGEFASGVGADAVHFYANGGRSYPGMMGSLGDLVHDLGRMRQYHIIFVPCGSDSNTAVLNEPAVLQNIREYVSLGGKLYVTDWSGEWHDNVFPAQVELEPGADTPASAYDAATGTWNTALFGNADGSLYNSDNAEAADPDLFTWLDGQYGPLPDSASTGTFNAAAFSVVDNWNTVMSLNSVVVGYDDEGLALYDVPRAFVIGGEGTSLPKRPLTVTYEPAGCGRVLYSTYHTTPNSHVGLVPQERILLFLIMEIGTCTSGPILI
ncbi:MAG: carboxypeptidase-like regulatory domain-containing protein [Myxococcales bacterium]|nr:carboxypeptidase-like regulatory domain-containing protein [Myxococcales bacterium]